MYVCAWVTLSLFSSGPHQQTSAGNWLATVSVLFASKLRGGCVCLVALGCWSASFPRCRSAVSGQHTDCFLFLRLSCPGQFLAGSAGHLAALQEGFGAQALEAVACIPLFLSLRPPHRDEQRGKGAYHHLFIHCLWNQPLLWIKE